MSGGNAATGAVNENLLLLRNAYFSAVHARYVTVGIII